MKKNSTDVKPVLGTTKVPVRIREVTVLQTGNFLQKNPPIRLSLDCIFVSDNSRHIAFPEGS